MRPKIIFALLLVGLAGLGGIFCLKKLTVAPAPTSSAPVVHAAPIATAPPELPPAASQNIPIPPPAKPAAVISPAPAVHTVASNSNGVADEHATEIQARLDKLQELQSNEDAASLQAILAELANSDKTIRSAAVESAIQFGSRDAIPVLKDFAARTADPTEKKQLLDAADFLALPTLMEIRARNAAAK